MALPDLSGAPKSMELPGSNLMKSWKIGADDVALSLTNSHYYYYYGYCYYYYCYYYGYC